MVYAFEVIDVDSYGQSTKLDGNESEYLGTFESRDEALKAFFAYGDERLEAEIEGGSKIKNVLRYNDGWSFDYWPNNWYGWIHEHHMLFAHEK